MRTIELYRKHKAGEVSREKFLYEVRRDNNIPWVTNTTSYTDAVTILKNKGIISESYDNQVGQHFDLKVKSERGDGSVQNYELKNVKLVNTNGRVFEKPDGTTVTLAPSDKYTSTRVDTTTQNEAWDEPYDGGPGDLNAMAKDANAKPLTGKELIAIAGKAGQIVPDAESELLDLSGYGDKIPRKKVDDILANYEITYADLRKVKAAPKEKWLSIDDLMDRGYLEEAKKAKKTDDPNQIHPYEYRLGLQYELEQGNDYSNEAFEKAKAKVLKNLNKNFNYYTNCLNAEKSPFTFKAPETDKPGMQAKADGHLKKELKKDEKSNVKDTQGKKEAGKKKPKGVKVMPDKGVTGTEKKLKEGISFMDFFLDEAMRFQDLPADPEKYKTVKDSKGYIIKATNADGVEFQKGDEVTAVDNGEKIKIAKFEESQGKIKAIYSTGMFYKAIDIDGLNAPKETMRPGVDLGKSFEKFKKMKEVAPDAATIQKAKATGQVLNVSKDDKTALDTLKRNKVNFTTY